MKSVFCGRDAELAVLQAAFEALAGPQPSPQIVVLLAEPGLGKTRLAQEFYHWLSTSKEVTPGPGYWPDMLDRVGNTMRVTPDPAACDNQVAMSFLWWGMRLPEAAQGMSVGTLAGALHDLRPHLEPMYRAQRMRERMEKSGRAAGDALFDIAVGMAETATGLGTVKSIGFALFELLKLGREQSDESTDATPLSETVNQGRLDMTQSLIADLRLVLGGQGTRVPAVLLIDDAQFSAADPGLNHFLAQLLDTAAAEHWPLMVVVTHWEREWYQQAGGGALDSVAGVIGARLDDPALDVRLVPIGKIDDLSPLLASRLPGLRVDQIEKLISRADGNPRFLEEIATLALEEPQHFEGKDTNGPLTDEGLEALLARSTRLYDVIRTRFIASSDAVQNALVLASLQGVDFARVLVEHLGISLAIDSVAEGVVEAEHPHSFVRGAEQPLPSFAQGIYRQVAQDRLPALFEPHQAEAGLKDAVRSLMHDNDAFAALSEQEQGYLRHLAVHVLGASAASEDLALAASSLGAELRWRENIGDIWGAAEIGTRYVEAVELVDAAHLDTATLGLVAMTARVAGVSQLAIAALTRAVEGQRFKLERSRADGEADGSGWIDAAIALFEMLQFRCISHLAAQDPAAAAADIEEAITLLQPAMDAAHGEKRVVVMTLLAVAAGSQGMALADRDAGLAAQKYSASIELLEEIRRDFPAIWNVRRAQLLASGYHNRALIFPDAKRREADLSTAIALRNEAGRDLASDVPEHVHWLANGYGMRSAARRDLNDLDGALADLVQAVNIRLNMKQQMGFAHPLEYENAAIEDLKRLAGLASQMNDPAMALTAYDRAVELAENIHGRMVAGQPVVAPFLLLDLLKDRAAEYGRQSRWKEAADGYGRAITAFNALAPDRTADRRQWLIDAHFKRGEALQNVGERKAALSEFDHAVTYYLDRPGRETDGNWEWSLASYLQWRASTLVELGRYQEALDDGDAAISLRERAKFLKQQGWTDEDEYYLAEAYASRAYTHLNLGRRKENLEDRDRCISGKERLRARAASPWPRGRIAALAGNYTDRGVARHNSGAAAGAEADHRMAISLLEDLPEPRSATEMNYLANAHHNLALVTSGAGRIEEALGGYQLAVSLRLVIADTGQTAMRNQERWLANGYDGQAGALFRLGRFAEAAEARRRSIEVREGIRDRLGANWTARENVYLAEIYLALADSLSRAGEAAEVSDAATVAVNIWTETSLLHPELFTLHIRNSLERAKQLRMG